VLPEITERFSEKHPRVVIRGDIVAPPSHRFPALRDRTHDLILSPGPPGGYPVDDLNVEVLFDDSWVVVAGMKSQWAQRRKVELRELIDEPWLLPPPDTDSRKNLEHFHGGLWHGEAPRVEDLCQIPEIPCLRRLHDPGRVDQLSEINLPTTSRPFAPSAGGNHHGSSNRVSTFSPSADCSLAGSDIPRVRTRSYFRSRSSGKFRVAEAEATSSKCRTSRGRDARELSTAHILP
jgi:DNA-binding transcriptional LysR family regulator